MTNNTDIIDNSPHVVGTLGGSNPRESLRMIVHVPRLLDGFISFENMYFDDKCSYSIGVIDPARGIINHHLPIKSLDLGLELGDKMYTDILANDNFDLRGVHLKVVGRYCSDSFSLSRQYRENDRHLILGIQDSNPQLVVGVLAHFDTRAILAQKKKLFI